MANIAAGASRPGTGGLTTRLKPCPNSFGVRTVLTGIELPGACGVTIHTGVPIGAGARGVGAGIVGCWPGVTDQTGVPNGTPVGGSAAGESVPSVAGLTGG